jgi:hypothetical protein
MSTEAIEPFSLLDDYRRSRSQTRIARTALINELNERRGSIVTVEGYPGSAVLIVDDGEGKLRKLRVPAQRISSRRVARTVSGMTLLAVDERAGDVTVGESLQEPYSLDKTGDTVGLVFPLDGIVRIEFPVANESQEEPKS